MILYFTAFMLGPIRAVHEDTSRQNNHRLLWKIQMFQLENFLFPNIPDMNLSEVVDNVQKNGRVQFIPPVLVFTAHCLPLTQPRARKQCLHALADLSSLVSYSRITFLHQTQPTQQYLPFRLEKLRIYIIYVYTHVCVWGGGG